MQDLRRLETGPLFRFSNWPESSVPDVAAGVYTVWKGKQLIYVGMSGRGWTVRDVREKRAAGKRAGLWTRLNSHASGRRSGDQFCVYVCDRFIVPELTASQRRQLAAGSLSLDGLTREYIRSQLTYRWTEVADGAGALRVERLIRRDGFRAGLPLLNPISRGGIRRSRPT